MFNIVKNSVTQLTFPIIFSEFNPYESVLRTHVCTDYPVMCVRTVVLMNSDNRFTFLEERGSFNMKVLNKIIVHGQSK